MMPGTVEATLKNDVESCLRVSAGDQVQFPLNCGQPFILSSPK